ncbi:MAG: transposase, partial [Thermoanaerobaculia bacterium]|nr:transposase [Thermoanaerobaculia bacterium]
MHADLRGRQQLSPAERLKLRKKKSRPIRTRLRAWLERQQNLHPPKSPIAVAIRYG